MTISEREIVRHLHGTLGQPLVVYEEIDSTNNAAKLLAKNGAPNGTLLVARQQTAGRGRLDRSFYSPKDAGVYFSVILRPVYAEQMLSMATAAAAVAVVRGIRTASCVRAQIKWVNDIYHNGKKLCGILAESAVGARGLEYIVLGMGINLTPAAYPEGVSATCLEAAGGGRVDGNILVGEILYQLEKCLAFGEFMDEYRQYSCVLGKTIRVYAGNGREYTAVAEGFDSQAHLRIRLPSGRRRTLCSGEISIRGDFT